ncbi:protein I'm not dead yet isoform X2 [Drosophila hydei]|nr:protein I'm not dead yet isoform X2 [Drosophila hydei]
MLPYPEQNQCKLFWKFHYKGVLMILIPILFAPILIGWHIAAYRLIYVGLCIYLYYILNVIPVGIIAFLLIIFLPLLGISDSNAVSMSYYADLLFTTYGSIFMGLMMDAAKLSDRLALIVISCCGTNIRVLQAFFMIMTCLSSVLFCSTFMCAFWMKIAQALLKEFADSGILKIDSDEETYERQAAPYPTKPVVGIYLTIAYSATLGAMASPFQDPNSTINFYLMSSMTIRTAAFLLLFICPMIIGLAVVAIWINLIFLGAPKDDLSEMAAAKKTMKQAMTDKKLSMGKWSVHSILAVIFIFLTMILLLLRDPPYFDKFQGWDGFIDTQNLSSVPIILMCVLYIAVPANYMFCSYYCCRQPEKKGTAPSMVGWRLLNNNTPWAQMLMLAAANALMFAYDDSKLMKLTHDWIAHQEFSKTESLFVGSLLASCLTNLSPAISVIRHTLLPITTTSNSMKIGTGGLVVPYATAIHNQFLLPVSTSSNTIVSGWGNVRPYQFLLGGIVPTIVMLLAIELSTYMLGGTVFEGY